MKVELTKSQITNLASFIQYNFIEEIRNNDDIDNINYLVDMCDAYKVLKEAEEQLKAGGKNEIDRCRCID